jgi:two-component system, sensor histidine kinase and response regulator
MRRLFTFGLTTRLVLLTVIAVLPALAIQTYNEYDLRHARENDIRDRVVQITKQFGEEMGELREGARQLLAAMARLPGIISMDGPKCEELLVSMKQSYPNYESLSVADTNGRTICSSSPDAPSSVADLPFFKRAMAQDSLVVGNYWVNPVSGAKAIHFAMKFPGKDGNTAGVVSVALDLNWLSGHLADRGLRPGASILIADREGNIIARLPNPDALVGKNMRKTHEGIMDGDQSGTEEAVGVDGITRIFGYVPAALPPRDLFLSAGLAKAEAFADIDRATRRGIALILAGLFVAVAAAVLVGRYFIRKPIQGLSRATADWRDGNYDVRVHAGDASSEIGQLAVAFNEMADALASRQAAQKQAEDDLLELTATLEDRVEKRTEELALANRVKSQFLANMSHEIRTPMNGVLGMLELLLEGELSTRQRRYAQTAFRSGESLLHIVNGVLDLSKIEAGKLQLSYEPFNLPTMIEEAVELFAGAARAKHVNLAHMISPEIPRTVVGDSGRIRQVLTNILGNAVKFTQAGEVVLFVNATDAGQNEVKVEFKVRDTGIGIPREKQGEIFDVFSQADQTTTRRYGGTGLGLSIARQLCELMGGSINVESEPGAGSEFQFSVTLRKVASDPGTEVVMGWPSLTGRSAVIVDDNSTNLEILQNHLTRVGVRTRLVTNADAALGVLQESADAGAKFDFILIDKVLPTMDGCELACRIEADETLAGIRIVILSSSEDMSDTNCPEHIRWLVKPVRRTELYECLAGTDSVQPEAKPERPSLPQTSVGVAACRVMLVEDNDVNMEVARSILVREGCQVTTAVDGKEALTAFEGGVFDVIFMDCQMPEMDGFDATAAIRAREAGTRRHTPIVALTANAIAGDREHCLRSGMDDYISKPVSRQAIQIMLERWRRNANKASPDLKDAAGDRSPVRQDVKLNDEALGVLRSLEDDENPGILRKIMSMFLESTPGLLETLRRAGNDEDIDRIRTASHTLKSASASIGATSLSAACAKLEILAREGGTDDAPALVEAIVREYETIRPLVEAHAHGAEEYAAE